MIIGSPKCALGGIICRPLYVPSIAPQVLQAVKPNYTSLKCFFPINLPVLVIKI